jgi:hypothetical protein
MIPIVIPIDAYYKQDVWRSIFVKFFSCRMCRLTPEVASDFVGSASMVWTRML